MCHLLPLSAIFTVFSTVFHTDLSAQGIKLQSFMTVRVNHARSSNALMMLLRQLCMSVQAPIPVHKEHHLEDLRWPIPSDLPGVV